MPLHLGRVKTKSVLGSSGHKSTAVERMEGRKAGNNTVLKSTNAMKKGFGAKGPMPSSPKGGGFGTGNLSDF